MVVILLVALMSLKWCWHVLVVVVVLVDLQWWWQF